MAAMFFIAFGFFALLPMGNEYPSVTPEGTCKPISHIPSL